MPQPPSLSPEQRQAALAKAAHARRARAELKERLKMGSIDFKELLDQGDGDDVVGKMKVLAVLESLPGVGKVSVAWVPSSARRSWPRSAPAAEAAEHRHLRPGRGRERHGRLPSARDPPRTVAQPVLDHADPAAR